MWQEAVSEKFEGGKGHFFYTREWWRRWFLQGQTNESALMLMQISCGARGRHRQQLQMKFKNVSPTNSANRQLRLKTRRWNPTSLPLCLPLRHTHTQAHMREYRRFIFPRSIPHTCHKCWMIASTAPPVHCGRRLITHMILEMKWLATWSRFSLPPLRGKRERERGKRLNKCATYRPLDNWGYYGYVFRVGDTCHGRPCAMDNNQSPDLWAE